MEANQNIALFGQDLHIKTDRVFHVTVGSLQLWIEKNGNEWQVAYQHDVNTEDRPLVSNEVAKPNDLSWHRWIVSGEEKDAKLLPLLPDRAVVVRPESPVFVQPGQSTMFYIGVPIWVAVSVGQEAIRLCELPSVKLSKSWFGTPTDGEPCYAMRTWARQRPEQLMPRPHRAICPVQIRNISSDVLDFERIRVRCQHLNLYKGKRRLWSNAVRLSYRGQNQWSRVVYAGGPPNIDDTLTLLSPARESAGRGLLETSFQRLRGRGTS